MLKRWLLALRASLCRYGIVAVAAALYLFFGLRVRLDGGGTPRPTFVVDAETQADVIARHREAQRRELAQEAARPGGRTDWTVPALPSSHPST